MRVSGTPFEIMPSRNASDTAVIDVDRPSIDRIWLRLPLSLSMRLTSQPSAVGTIGMPSSFAIHPAATESG